MSLLNLNEILSSVNGKFVGNTNNMSKFGFSSVTTDSRGVCKGSLFVPLIGQVQDGHKYIPSAIEKGASVIFVAEKNIIQILKNTIPFLKRMKMFHLLWCVIL